MLPPHIQLRQPSVVRGIIPDHLTFDEHPTQGVPGSMGVHGWGLITPMGGTGIMAATAGFEGDAHIPNPGTLTIGCESKILATDEPPT